MNQPAPRFGSTEVRRLGAKRHLTSDYFHRLLRARWRSVIALLASGYFGGNLLFALGYWAAGDVIENARPGSFLDAYFFSSQTMATVGYGKLHPIGAWANVLASIEAFVGLLGFAVAAGLIFAKFSRPTAKIVFSRTAVVQRRDGQLCLVFRVVNERNNQVLEAGLSATFLCTRVTAEGERLRQMTDMKLVRNRTPVFSLTWTAIHPIDADSPLFEKTPADLQAMAAEVIVAFAGVDDAFSSAIHARHSYLPQELEWGRRFQDLLNREPSGAVVIDYSKFHLTQDAPKDA